MVNRADGSSDSTADQEDIIPENILPDSSDSISGDDISVSINSEIQASEPVPKGKDSSSMDDSSEDDFLNEDDDLKADYTPDFRRRRKSVEGLAKAFGMDGAESIEMMKLLDSLLPDGDRLSTSQDVFERLEYGFKDLRRYPNSLVFTRQARRRVDITTAPERFKHNAVLDGIMDSEEELMKALFVNERTMAGLSHWVSEHQQIRSLLMAEMVRRATVSEQWRHMLPKYMLPIFSMIQAAGASQKMARVNGALFNRIRDAIIDWSKGALSREYLLEAAKRTEDEFLTALKGDYVSRMQGAQEGVGPIADEQVSGSAPVRNDSKPAAEKQSDKSLSSYDGEAFEDGQKRLRMLLLSAREDLTEIELQADLVSEEDVSAAGTLVENLMTVESLGGGIDKDGQLVFKSLGEFFGRLKTMETVDYRSGNLPDSLPDLVQKLDSIVSVRDFSGEKISEENILDDGDFNPIEFPTEATSGDGVASSETESVVTEHVAGDTPDQPEAEPVTTADSDPDIISYRDNLAEIIPAKMVQTDMFGTGSAPVSEPVTKPGQDESVAGDVTGLDDQADEQTEQSYVLQIPSEPAEPVELVKLSIPEVGRGMVVMAAEWVSPWPTTVGGLDSIMDDVPRSTGISKSLSKLTSRQAFAGWTPYIRGALYGHMSVRRHFDISAKEGKEGNIQPLEWSRPELMDGPWQATAMVNTSTILGRSHPFIMPPNSSLAWYGRELGWSEAEIRSIVAFGSPAHPESVTAKGDPVKLVEAMRGVVRMQLQKLMSEAPAHFLSERAYIKPRHELACEHLSRWWIFMLLARHRMEDFDLIFTGDFFNGVYGPDFIIDPTGEANFGTLQSSSHAILHRKGEFERATAGPRAASESLVSGPPPLL